MSGVDKPSHLFGQRSLISFYCPVGLTHLTRKADADFITMWRRNDLSGEVSPSHPQSNLG